MGLDNGCEKSWIKGWLDDWLITYEYGWDNALRDDCEMDGLDGWLLVWDDGCNKD